MNAKLMYIVVCLFALAALGCEQSANPSFEPTVGDSSDSSSAAAENQASDGTVSPSPARTENIQPRTDYEKRQEELRVEIQNYTDELDNVFTLFSQPEGDGDGVRPDGSAPALTSSESSLPIRRR